MLDPILIPTDLEYSDCGTFPLPQAISEHCATYISIPFPYQTQPCFERTIWLYKRANHELLNQNVSDYKWNVLLNVLPLLGSLLKYSVSVFSIKPFVFGLTINHGMIMQ